MPEQVYDRAALKKRALELLQKCGAHLTTSQIAMQLGVQSWAADQALEEAYQAREVNFAAGAGWLIAAAPEKRPAADDRQAQIEGEHHD